MSNPIDGIGQSRPPIAPGTSGVKQSQQPADTAPAAGSDVVQLTNTATSLQQMEKDLATEPAIDPAKISAMKDAIASGDYKIDAERVAEKFMEVEKALGKL